MTFSIRHIREAWPCYDPARHLPEDWEGTALDILAHNTIPANDKLWVVLSVPEALSSAAKSLILARVVLPLARRYADAAGAAACDAVIALHERSAAGDEPAGQEWGTAWAAACAAERGAARTAARAAAWAAAAWIAAGSVAWVAAECASERASERAAGWIATWGAERAAACTAAWVEMAESTTRLLTAAGLSRAGEVAQ